MGYARKDVEKTKKIAKKYKNDCDRSCLAGTGKSIEQT